MSRITKQNIASLKALVSDKKLSLAQRKEAHRQVLDGMLNPFPTFDPNSFDPMAGGVEDYEVKKRARKAPKRRLPTMGMLPKELMEGQMIGMFESKQDLYLMIAWLSERVSDLEDALKALQVKPK
jgi:hypothetical protein